MSSGGETIGIIGAGWVGLVTGACFADLGHRVIVRDVVLERNKERISFTLELSDVTDQADFLFICVGTPPTYSGDADLSAVWAVVDELPALERRQIVIMKSTVPAGTGEK